MSQLNNKEQQKVEIVEDLLKKRSSFISIKAKIWQIVEPKLFQIYLENLANVRNSIIISGALTTVGWLVFDNTDQVFSPVANLIFRLSIILFLLAIFVYSFYLKSNLAKSIFFYQKEISKNVATAEKAEKIINDCLDGKITKKDADKNLMEVYKEIEFERIRGKSSESGGVIQKYLAMIGNMFFVSAIISLIFAFSYDLIRSLFIKIMENHNWSETMKDFLSIIGLSLSLLGSLCLARGLFISKKEALKLGISRWASEKDEENLTLPQVQDRLNQRIWGIIGAIFLFIGFILQIMA